jgi:CsoR family transcriptional regulator, copper-sensing transcriptional repressor
MFHHDGIKGLHDRFIFAYTYTLYGYIITRIWTIMKPKTKTPRENILARLNRIEGQVRGLRKMIEDGRPCMDVLRKTAATDAALRATAKLIVTQHLDTCFTEAVTTPAYRKQLFNDLLESFGRF